MITPCDYCEATPPLRFTYNFANLCCAIRYLRNAPESKRAETLKVLAKNHDIEALKASLDPR